MFYRNRPRAWHTWKSAYASLRYRHFLDFRILHHHWRSAWPEGPDPCQLGKVKLCHSFPFASAMPRRFTAWFWTGTSALTAQGPTWPYSLAHESGASRSCRNRLRAWYAGACTVSCGRLPPPCSSASGGAGMERASVRPQTIH